GAGRSQRALPARTGVLGAVHVVEDLAHARYRAVRRGGVGTVVRLDADGGAGEEIVTHGRAQGVVDESRGLRTGCRRWVPGEGGQGGEPEIEGFARRIPDRGGGVAAVRRGAQTRGIGHGAIAVPVVVDAAGGPELRLRHVVAADGYPRGMR